MFFLINFVYEHYYCSFNKLTERHYEKSPWPDAEYVASIVDGGKLMQLLYSAKESHDHKHSGENLKPHLSGIRSQKQKNLLI